MRIPWLDHTALGEGYLSSDIQLMLLGLPPSKLILSCLIHIGSNEFGLCLCIAVTWLYDRNCSRMLILKTLENGLYNVV